MICNQSFGAGIGPMSDNMKVARVIPLFKSGYKNSFHMCGIRGVVGLHKWHAVVIYIRGCSL